uniref:Alternative protein ITGA9 n=1 Tax=Homo sapiens TaxID=9606 RepID=L8E7C7_HUMAN|nr:alternative protein ITGA9 [Homo sapiens]
MMPMMPTCPSMFPGSSSSSTCGRRRRWASPVSCWNRTSSNAAWDFLS